MLVVRWWSPINSRAWWPRHFHAPPEITVATVGRLRATAHRCSCTRKAGKPAPPITLPENDEVQSEPVPAFDQPQPLAPREVTSPTPRKVEMAICHDDRDRPGRADRGGSRRHRTIWLQRIEGHAPRASPLKCPGVPGSAVLCVLLARWTPPGPGLVLLLCWPQRPRSAVAQHSGPGPVTLGRAPARGCQRRPFFTRCGGRPKTGCRRLPLACQPSRYPLGQAGNDPP